MGVNIGTEDGQRQHQAGDPGHGALDLGGLETNVVMLVGEWRAHSSVSVNGNVDQVEDGNVGQKEIKEWPPGTEKCARDQTKIDISPNCDDLNCCIPNLSFLDILMAVMGMETEDTRASAAARDTTWILFGVWSLGWRR